MEKEVIRGVRAQTKESLMHMQPSLERKTWDCMSTLQKEHAKEDVCRMEVEEGDVGPKRKIRAPLSEVGDNMEARKKLKLNEEVVALGKLMAKQMGSAVAAGQPRRDQ